LVERSRELHSLLDLVVPTQTLQRLVVFFGRCLQDGKRPKQATHDGIALAFLDLGTQPPPAALVVRRRDGHAVHFWTPAASQPVLADLDVLSVQPRRQRQGARRAMSARPPDPGRAGKVSTIATHDEPLTTYQTGVSGSLLVVIVTVSTSGMVLDAVAATQTVSVDDVPAGPAGNFAGRLCRSLQSRELETKHRVDEYRQDSEQIWPGSAGSLCRVSV
jgi:hypothetical protein